MVFWLSHVGHCLSQFLSSCVFTVRCKILNHSVPATKQTTSYCNSGVFVFTNNVDIKRNSLGCQEPDGNNKYNNCWNDYFWYLYTVNSLFYNYPVTCKKKIRTLQHSPAVTDQTSRMNIVVTLIISIFVLFRLSNIVTDILILMFVFRVTSFPSYETRLYNFYFYTFIGCINFSCNPCILFFSQYIKNVWSDIIHPWSDL